jgi:hypothetical protein
MKSKSGPVRWSRPHICGTCGQKHIMSNLTSKCPICGFYSPTKEEIAAQCEELRNTWSKPIHRSRLKGTADEQHVEVTRVPYIFRPNASRLP